MVGMTLHDLLEPGTAFDAVTFGKAGRALQVEQVRTHGITFGKTLRHLALG